MEEQKLAMEMPSLTLDPFGEAEVTQKAEEVTTQPQAESDLAMEKLTDEERKLVESFAKQIDITNSQVVLQYGAAAQTKISGFSEQTLEKVKTKDLGEVGKMVSTLVTELKEFDPNEEETTTTGGFFKKKIKKAKKSMDQLKADYTKVDKNIEEIKKQLQNHQVVLMKDIATLDQLYEINMANYKELTLYILAGQKALQEAKDVKLAELKRKAEASGTPEDAQAANDYGQLIDRFEKKIYDLETTRVVAIQMAPQIRLVQNNDTLMVEKIQSVIVNTIPLWRSQMVLALGINHSKEAMEATREVTNMTNMLLKKNADTLKSATIETTKESERAIVDLETLQYTNQSLIDTLDEVIRIQDEGRTKRAEAEVELKKLEAELKSKLLEIHIK